VLNEDQPSARNLPPISVVICCHNSAARLPETLRHLALQRIPPGLSWEILVIDNGSTDNTSSVIDAFASEHPDLRVRVVGEPRLGQAVARQRGIVEAANEIILFVDDDNWLAAEYVAVVAETMERHPEIGGLGGMSLARCEGPEPEWLSKYQGWYAVTGNSEDAETLNEVNFLWTAGAAFRRRALDRANGLGLPLLVAGRRGDTLDGGEDHELCHLVRLSGQRLYRHAGMKFDHYLPARRLTWAYLRRLLYASGTVSVKLDAYRHGYSRQRSMWPGWMLRSWSAQFFNVCWRLLRHPIILWRSKRQLLEGDDRVLQMEAYRGRLAALWSCRRMYRKMVNVAIINPRLVENPD
jgi:glycosyltransferase involved in cell wall biosynthesis